METSRITGDGPDGHQHTMRITHGGNNQRYVVCDSCGYRKRAGTFARAKAEQHLSESHGAGDFQQEIRAWPIVLGVIGFIVFLVVMASYRNGR
ncbi:hypothetical protein [Kitasatospora sp. NPDC088351]|uniref:hypothetical protein n=1 Tax=unclassified Kitasatospora TaxID=2633591 RepID=UPI00341DF482